MFTSDDPARDKVEPVLRKLFGMSQKQRTAEFGLDPNPTAYAIDLALGQRFDLSRSTIRKVREEMYAHLAYDDKPWRFLIPDDPTPLQRQLSTMLNQLAEDDFDFRGLMATANINREELDRVMNGDPVEDRTAERLASALDNLRKQTRGNCVRYMRDAVGLSGSKFAKLIGCSESTLSRWENGHSTPSANSLFEMWERCEGLAFDGSDNARRGLVALLRGDLTDLKNYLAE